MEIKKQTCILILGMHRSGTSAIAGEFAQYGVDFGRNLMKPTADNEKGYYENLDAFYINEQLLKSINCSWDYLPVEYPVKFDYLSHNKAVINITEFLKKEFSESAVFSIKDPRLSVTLPVWKEALEILNIKITYVLVCRNPLDTILSLVKRDEMAFEKGELLWINYSLRFINHLKNQKFHIANYDELVNNPGKIHLLLKQIKPDFLPSKKMEISHFIDKSLKHQKGYGNNEISPFSKQLYEYILRKDFSDVNMEKFTSLWNLFYNRQNIDALSIRTTNHVWLEYWNGESYEPLSTQLTINDGVFNLNFDIPVAQHNIKKFRFKLLVNSFIKLSQLEIFITPLKSNTPQKLSDSRINHNGKNEHTASLVFNNFTPHLLINLEGLQSGIHDIIITGNINTLNIENEWSNLKKDNLDLQKQLETERKTIPDFTEIFDQLKKNNDINSYREKIISLTKENKNLIEENKTLHKALSEHDNKFLEYNANFNTQREKFLQLAEANESLKNIINDQDEKIIKLNSEANNHRQRFNKLINENESLRNELLDQDNNVQLLNEELQKFKEKSKQFEIEKDQVINRLNNDLTTFKNERNRFNAKITELSLKVKQLQTSTLTLNHIINLSSNRYYQLAKNYLDLPNSAKWLKVQKLLYLVYKLYRKIKPTRISEDYIFHPFIFDANYYKSKNVELSDLNYNDLKSHWYHKGHKEGLVASKCFDVKYYLSKNPDLNHGYKRDYPAAIEHWLIIGIEEGRDCSPNFNMNDLKSQAPQISGSNYAIIENYLLNRNIPEPTSTSEKVNDKNKKALNSLTLPVADKVSGSIEALTISDKINEKIKALKEELQKAENTPDSPESILKFNKNILLQKHKINSDNQPLVSIIMPCWNRVEIIKRAVESALAQSYRNFQLIISDDGSTDGTVELIQSTYSEEIFNGKIIIVKNPNRSGVSSARNKGLAVASGKYIAYLDSDNAWDSDFLKIMIGELEYSNASSAYCGIIIFNTSKNRHNILLKKEFVREDLEATNFIDLNAFVHEYKLYEKRGGFDEQLTRLVDWDLILKYTYNAEPKVVEVALVEYYLQENIDHITIKEKLYNNYNLINQKEYLGSNLIKNRNHVTRSKDDIRIGYILWEFPVLSETFIMNELRWLVNNNYYIEVFYKNPATVSAELDFTIEAHVIEDADDLSEKLISRNINYLHSHFVYPTTTLLTYPASEKTGIPFSFTGHGVDMFHEKNLRRMQIKEITRSENCYKTFAIGKFHRLFYLQHGVPEEKISLLPMGIDVDYFRQNAKINSTLNFSVCCISRFVEKKGIKYLIEAASYLPKISFDIYGYGPEQKVLEDIIRDKNLLNVQIHPALKSKNDVISALSNHDLFVMPCVKASNADMDGLPVVFMEAMSLGIPVISSDISSISDMVINNYTGFLAEPRNVPDIVKNINTYYQMSKAERIQIQKNCITHVSHNYNTNIIMKKLERIWLGLTVDIFLVSYENLSELKEIIRRVFKYTLTPFRLTVVDNNSSIEVKNYLKDLSDTSNIVEVVLLSENIFCGPASNLALEKAKSQYIIYLCSKEAFILDFGWEDNMIQYMENNSDIGLAGHLAYSPSYYHSKDLKKHPLFKKFRNQEYVNKKEFFHHVQGGIYILRKEMYEQIGGFNPDTPQDMMDVEYSYYVESCGWKIGSISNLYSLTVKTRPTLNALIDENTKIAHPLTLNSLKHFSDISNALIKNCNICNWSGTEFHLNIDSHICPECKSNDFHRTLFRYLAESDLMYRKLHLLEIDSTGCNNEELRKAFVYHSISSDKDNPDFLSNNYSILIINKHTRNNKEFLNKILNDISSETIVFSQIMLNVLSSNNQFEEQEIFLFSEQNRYLKQPMYCYRENKNLLEL